MSNAALPRRTTAPRATASAARSRMPEILLGTALCAVPAIAAARTPPLRCLPGEDSPRFMRLVGPELQFCLDDGSSLGGLTVVDINSDLSARAAVRCFGIHLASKHISLQATPTFSRPLPRLTLPPPSKQIVLNQDGADFCDAPTQCKTLRASADVDPGLGLTAAVSQDGTLAALAYLGEQPTVEIFELASGKRLAELHGRDPKAMCISAELLGATVLVRERDCGKDALSRSWLADAATGKLLGEAGGTRSFAAGASPSISPAHLSGDDWAFPAARGEAVVIQNVRTGKLKKRIALGARSTPATPISDGKRLVLAYEGKRLGDLAVIELASYKVTKLAGTRCPKPSATR